MGTLGQCTLADLPASIPVFPLAGALLLPGSRLPLTVFEPRYLALVDDALGAGRLFGLIQPRAGSSEPLPELYTVGCLARIVSFAEAGGGRYVITAAGLCRFQAEAEQEGRAGYRRLAVDYAPFKADLEPAKPALVDRVRLMAAVSTYLARHGVAVDMARLTKSSDTDLVDGLAMASPLSPEEKQAILEAPTPGDRARLLTALFEMALMGEDVSSLH